MIRALIVIIFILAASAWLRWEIRKNVSLSRYWKWIAAAIAFQLSAQIISNRMSDQFLGNILLHMIGGGITSTCLFFYMIRTFDVKINWRLQLALLFMFVSALGVLNELWEFSFELLHLGKYSFDTHDTWRDLASNTFGSLLAWVVIRVVLYARRFARN
jgi:glycopeptide antibiotics resistance protein